MSFQFILMSVVIAGQAVAMSHVDISVNESKACYPCICIANQTIAICSHLDLPAVPVTLPKTITTLLMDHNRMTRLPSTGFSKFENLTQLDISNNAIEQVMDGSFLGLQCLKRLRMEQNDVQLPANALSALISLEELSVDGNENMIFNRHFKNLSKLTNLSISGKSGRCNMNNIYNHTFTYVPHLKILDLSSCDLNNIDAGAFLPLRNIEELDISDNHKLYFENFQNATYGLINSSIRILKANRIVKEWSLCNILYRQNTQHLSNTRLQELYFDYNRLELFGKGALLNLPDTLWYISARHNMLTYGDYIKDLQNMKSVTHIYLGNDIKPLETDIPFLNFTGDSHSEVCEIGSENNCHSFEQTDEEDLDSDTELLPSSIMQNSYYKPIVIQVVIPPHLQVLQVTYEQLSFDITRIHTTPNNLTTLNLTCNLLSNWIGPVEGLEKLEVLDLSNNLAINISTFFFKSFPRLKILNISLNFVGSIMHMGNKSLIFDNLTSLEILVISNNDIHYLPEMLFRDLVSLKSLDLSDNAIYLNLPLEISHMSNLQMLDLTNNHVRWFSRMLIQELDKLTESNNITIKLILNPISCTCKNLDFLNWMTSTKVSFLDIQNYTCAFDNKTFSSFGTLEHTVTLLEEKCDRYIGLVFLLVFGLLPALVLIGGAMAYRHQWKLRYVYHAAILRYGRRSQFDAQLNVYPFAAFVSHADEDKEFVGSTMLSQLETRARRLMLHERDFLAGRVIPTNILSAIQRSRKTVVVLSRYFLESEWCMYELQMANMESIQTGRDVLIIIMYEDISTKEIPKEVLYHLKTESYIDYPRDGDTDDVALFWKRLILAIENT